jgi:hypothetical protein
MGDFSTESEGRSRGFSLVFGAYNASRTLHKRLLDNILSLPMVMNLPTKLSTTTFLGFDGCVSFPHRCIRKLMPTFGSLPFASAELF